MRGVFAFYLGLCAICIAGCGDSGAEEDQRRFEYSRNEREPLIDPSLPQRLDDTITKHDRALIDRVHDELARLEAVGKWDKQAEAYAEALLHADDWRGRGFVIGFLGEAYDRGHISKETAQAYFKRAHDQYPKEAGFWKRISQAAAEYWEVGRYSGSKVKKQ